MAKFKKKNYNNNFQMTYHKSFNNQTKIILKVSNDGGKTFKIIGSYLDYGIAVSIAEDFKNLGYEVLLIEK